MNIKLEIGDYKCTVHSKEQLLKELADIKIIVNNNETTASYRLITSSEISSDGNLSIELNNEIQV